jgi:hypothetical protein
VEIELEEGRVENRGCDIEDERGGLVESDFPKDTRSFTLIN